MNLNIGMVMGEVSGDALGAPLISALKTYAPELTVEGILGERALQIQNTKSFFPMERLSVVGLIEPLFRIPELFNIRHKLIKHFTQNPPDVFIGIDAPDFNLGLERRLKARKIPTVHYVSPTVWAWRKGRIHGIKKSVDLMLALFPFEAKFYDQHKVPVCFTGHPLADQIPLEIDSKAAKVALGFSEKDPILALLPGSRDKELFYLAERYLKTAAWCYKQCKELKFVLPVVNERHLDYMNKLHLEHAPEIPLKILLRQSSSAIAACDVALVKAGTGTLEVMLHKKPMVATYRMNPLSFQIAKRLVKIPFLTLPNLLAEEQLFPEFVQDDVIPENLGPEILKFLEGKNVDRLHKRFMEMHQILRRGASKTAASAIQAMILNK